MAKTMRSGAKKARGGRGVRKGPRRAVPPPDDPLARHEDLIIDRLAATNGGGPVAALARTSGAIIPRKRTTRTGKTADGTEAVLATAHLRLAALRHAGSMRHSEQGTPVGAARLAGTEVVAPVPGISNWVQMGPTVIPNGQTYSSTRVRVTGRVTAIAIDPSNPQTIYLAAAQGGIWKTADGGKHWSPTSDNEVSLAIGALAIDPSNPQVVYAGTGEGNFALDSYYGSGVLQSTNGGLSWTNLNPGGVFTGARFSRLAITPGAPQRIFAATNGGIYRSTDSGVGWTQMTSGLPAGAATDVVIDPATPATVYAAFWGQGIYRTTTAGATNPAWTKLTSGLPTSGFTRVALGLAASSPQTLYALMSGPSNPTPSLSYLVNRFLRSTNGGSTWSAIALPGGNIGGQGFYNLNVVVDPTTPDIVYLSALSVWKASRDAATGAWTITNIGATIHPDNHAFAVDPTNHLVVYAGNDGGIYTSTNGGTGWSDAINEGPCITQFEFIAQHPTSDAVVFGGTQDNGTEQFRNSAVFYHADDGDGGFTAVDPNQPHNVVSTYYGPTPKRSVQGGKFGTWTDISSGLTGPALFYPPLALDETNPSNIAFGTDRIALDAAQGTGGWPIQITLAGITGNVSAIHYVTSTLIYVGTTSGQVYRLQRSGSTWTAAAIHAAPLPGNWIWDIVARPDDANTIIIGMSGFGISHVWRGTVPATGPASWTNVSGSGAGTTLPDIPVNAVVIDPTAPNTYYIGTDVGVYRTTNGGTTWTQFSQGLPNCAVFDIRLHAPSRLLRVGLHGRGMWERRLDVAAMPNADVFVRDHLMDTARSTPSPANVAAAFEDPLQHVALGDPLRWWMCADIKVDALEGEPPAYQAAVADVDYAAFDSVLAHRNAQRGRINRVYVQIHNRGIQAATGVTVKLLYADASAGLPPLPADFWSAFPANSGNTTQWTPIGAARVIPSLPPTEAAVLEWDWNTPAAAADHSCLLVIVDSASDPIPASNKLFDPGQLAALEKRIGLKNLHVVNALPGTQYWTPFRFFALVRQLQTVKIVDVTASGWSLGLIFEKSVLKEAKLSGIVQTKPTSTILKALRQRIGPEVNAFNTASLYMVKNIRDGGSIAGLKLPDGGLRAMLLLAASPGATSGGKVTILQEQDGRLVGGSTFVLRVAK